MPATTRRASRKTTRRAVAPGRSFDQLRHRALGLVEGAVRQGGELQQKAHRAVLARAAEVRAGTVEAATRLERMFEQRVSRAIEILGVPSARDVRSLSRQVAQLQESVEKLRRSRARA